MHWVINSIKLPSSGKIQRWIIYTHAIWIPSSTIQYLLCNFLGWIWSSASSFLSVLWWRGVSLCYRLTGEFWINLSEISIHRTCYWKSSKERSAFFEGKGKLFRKENCSSRTDSTSFSSRRRALGLFWNATKAATFWRILRYYRFFILWSRKLRF